MPVWNPSQYLVFKQERTQPSLDLISRIHLEKPGKILDLGCGPGNSTAALRARWPKAHVAGLDNSPEMIEAARKDFPGGEWVLGDLAAFEPREPYDLYFANAALQWLPDHETLLPRLYGFVKPGGALAVQVPDMSESPLAKSVVLVAHRPAWRDLTAGSERPVNYRAPEYYFPILNSLAARFELWQTTY
jgi:trans-aconitate 2-methyltransferase